MYSIVDVVQIWCTINVTSSERHTLYSKLHHVSALHEHLLTSHKRVTNINAKYSCTSVTDKRLASAVLIILQQHRRQTQDICRQQRQRLSLCTVWVIVPFWEVEVLMRFHFFHFYSSCVLGQEDDAPATRRSECVDAFVQWHWYPDTYRY